jgi:CheY-like chemotaxis protein
MRSILRDRRDRAFAHNASLPLVLLGWFPFLTHEKQVPAEVRHRLINIEQTGLFLAGYCSTISNFHERRRPVPINQEEHWDKVVSSGLDIQNKRPLTVATDAAAHSAESIPVTEAQAAGQFRFRILVVDDQYLIRETARQMLESGGYEVLTAVDGLDGLNALRKSLPDLIISDLNMPRMSGFEFLAVVRERFPHIATIAVSGEYIMSGNPSGVLADTFLQKGHYTLRELCGEVAKLLSASPIRSERKKSEIAPLFVPRDGEGYLIITCPKCLRPNRLEAMNLNGGVHETPCQSCGTPVRFEINHEIEPLMKRNHA